MAYRGPWALLGGESFVYKGLCGTKWSQYDAQKFENAIHLSEGKTNCISVRSLSDKVRTYFQGNWETWQWPEELFEESKKISTKLSTGSIEKLNEKK